MSMLFGQGIVERVKVLAVGSEFDLHNSQDSSQCTDAAAGHDFDAHLGLSGQHLSELQDAEAAGVAIQCSADGFERYITVGSGLLVAAG